MRIADCSTINDLQTWISRSNWLAHISKIERNHLDVFNVYYVQDKASRKTAIMVASIFNAKKKVWLESGDSRQHQKSNWAVIKKKLVAKTAPKNWDII